VPDEIATTYEFGAKSRFWGGRALLSLAAYHLDIKGYQDSYFDGNLVGFLVRSLPAKSSGLELEGQVQANGWLNIYGNIGWNPTAKLRLPNGVEERLQRAARFTGVLGARVSTDITEALSLSGTVQYQHSSGFYHQPAGIGRRHILRRLWPDGWPGGAQTAVRAGIFAAGREHHRREISRLLVPDADRPDHDDGLLEPPAHGDSGRALRFLSGEGRCAPPARYRK
jgi:outer membrane receptor protein involved in Fe transport